MCVVKTPKKCILSEIYVQMYIVPFDNLKSSISELSQKELCAIGNFQLRSVTLRWRAVLELRD